MMDIGPPQDLPNSGTKFAGASVKLEDQTGQQSTITSSAAYEVLAPHQQPLRRRGRPPKNIAPQSTSKPDTSAKTFYPFGVQPNLHQTFGQRASNRLSPKTVIKGNIIYERTETGEVIASVIRDGVIPRKATGDGAVLPGVKEIPRGRPPADLFPSSSPWLGNNGAVNIPPDCPVHEGNVEDILEETIGATQSMRRILLSLKDELRRSGGGVLMSPTLKPVHIEHRVEIAAKLARAFAEYRHAIFAISKSPTSDDADSKSTPVNVSNSSAPSDAKTTAPTVPPLKLKLPSSSNSPASKSPASTPVHGSRRKSSAPISSTKRKAAAAEQETADAAPSMLRVDPE